MTTRLGDEIRDAFRSDPVRDADTGVRDARYNLMKRRFQADTLKGDELSVIRARNTFRIVKVLGNGVRLDNISELLGIDARIKYRKPQ